MNSTPFVYGKIADRENFTNREADAAYLTNNFKGLINSVIISPRRWGKTSLVNKVIALFAENNEYIICRVDIFNCRTEEQFYTSLANAVLKASFSVWEEFVAGSKTYLSRMLPKIALTDGMQNYELSFGIDFTDRQLSVDEILDLPQKIGVDKNKKVIVCIDEFQNINEYPDTIGFQQKLRAHWQLHTRVCYCLFGSKRHMLLDIFNNYAMPFYKFGDILFLQKIAREDWISFISQRFSDTGKYIDNELCGRIADLVKNHPYYVQQLSQQVWLRTTTHCNESIVGEAFESLVNQLSLLFSNLIDSLTTKQISFLAAIAKGERAFSSKAVLNEYNLGTSANIKNLRKAVLDKDIIDILPGEKIELQDPLFEYWLLNCYLGGTR